MKIVSIVLVFAIISTMPGCGTIGGTIHGVGDDIVDLIKISYNLL